MTTNILVSVKRPFDKFTERFALPEHRSEIDRLYKETADIEALIHAPVMPCLDDKLWINDDPVFLLERMLYGTKMDMDARIRELADEYLYGSDKWNGDERILPLHDGIIVFKKDCSDLSHLHLLNIETDEFVEYAKGE